MINSSVLPALLHLLTSSQENLQKEACWAVSNITAGNRVQIQVTFFPSQLRLLNTNQLLMVWMLFVHGYYNWKSTVGYTPAIIGVES